MARYFFAVLLVMSGVFAAPAHAKPRVIPDTILQVHDDATLTLRDAGPAVLAGIVMIDRAAALPVLRAHGRVEIKSLGLDRYGRARIVLYAPAAKQPLQVPLLADGAALAYDRAATPKPWLQAEQQAQAQKRGVWGRDGLRMTPAQAGASVGQFHVVEGVVTRSFKSRSMLYLNFGEDWKTDFSVRIPRRAWRTFGKDFAVADGTYVRARGAIFLDNGPMIEITRPEQLERLDAHAP